MNKALAEWSKQELLMLALPHEKTDWKPYLDEILSAYKEFINAVICFQKVLLIGNDEHFYKANFKDDERVEFFQCPINDTWIRDFGAIDIMQDDRLVSLNFHFNAWGNKFQSDLDDKVNSKLFKDKFQSKLIDVDMVLEGGSIDFNGDGIMLTSEYCLLNENRNAHLSKVQIEDKLKQIFNLKQIIWLKHGFIKGDDTDRHIDTLARFISKDTIVHCVCEDKEDEHYEELLKMKEELSKTGFKLLELPLPKALFYEGKRLGATYANFVFVNDALILPVYADENDELVIKRLAKALPQRKIVPIDARVFLRQNGSLHCSCQNRFLGKR
ncbi:agamatine deiminase [Campylobacter sp. MIT 99-7217]|uniref:agmatine deiminase family protein n=1 Tax=Campylobacter sp. MIT 99-7217 TaxID=535091 RepID=UPI00115A836D|nr:agmatine deiminase family protein [Campylobacter sp. MIT 99-7217]TQR29527.1 agamatine deiminase [Campylobacter sp. MIT 99-7217]